MIGPLQRGEGRQLRLAGHADRRILPTDETGGGAERPCGRDPGLPRGLHPEAGGTESHGRR